MNYIRKMIFGLGGAALLAHSQAARGDIGTNSLPDFQEVREQIRSHLQNETDADLDHDSVLGLLHQLRGKVSLVTNKSSESASTSLPLLAKSVVYEGSIAYLQVSQVGPGLAAQVGSSLKALGVTNHLKGLTLDLRFAKGDDYSEAVAVANLFLSKERPIIDWGKGVISSSNKEDALTFPIAILINQETAAAAEALAAVLREADGAILLGAKTAGEANISQDYPLKNGQYLRIATSAIKLGNGEALSAAGINPDIAVTVAPLDEQAYFADPFKEQTLSLNLVPSIMGDAIQSGTNGTNRVSRGRPLNEAELIRERRERPGVEVDDLPLTTPASLAETENPIIRDPVLGRALDLIKGIAALHRPSSP